MFRSNIPFVQIQKAFFYIIELKRNMRWLYFIEYTSTVFGGPKKTVARAKRKKLLKETIHEAEVWRSFFILLTLQPVSG